MTNTSNFEIPLLYANQAQKDVTVNQALTRIDRMLQLNVLSRTLTLAPTLPTDGDKYIVATGATGVWSGQDGKLAVYETGAWAYLTPHAGWTAYVVAENAVYVYAASWVLLGYTSAATGLTDIAALSPVAGDLIVGDGAHWILQTPTQVFGQVAAMMALIYG